MVHKIIYANELHMDAGISKGMDSSIHVIGQCRNVEHKIRKLDKTVFGTTILYEGLH